MTMFQVRIHGRGGQGVVTAAELLSVAAFAEGRHAQAFPSFGSERTGAPVVAFCRIDDRPIRAREPIEAPDALIVQNLRLALSGLAVPVYDVVAGLGGRPITKRSLHALLADVREGRLEPGRLTFLDLDWGLVERELARTREKRRSGPHAENILRDVGAVAARLH